MLIAICGSRHQDRCLPDIIRFFSLLAEKGFSAQIHPRFYSYLTDRGVELPDKFLPVAVPSRDAVATLSLGGDGTFLRAAQWTGDSEIPILGINTGHLGFLAHCSLDDAPRVASILASGSFSSSPRMLLKVEGDQVPAHIWPFALNEVAILKEDTSSMINVNTRIDGYFLADYLADGLIIATPTGSTGYNLSVGGPIVQPELDCRVISPIAPHSLTMRPLVVGADAPIKATVTSRALTYRVSLDGRSFVMKCGSAITVSRAPFTVRAVSLPGDNFPSTLRQKLHWAVR